MPASVSPPYSSQYISMPEPSTKTCTFHFFQGPYIIVRDLNDESPPLIAKEYPKLQPLQGVPWPCFRRPAPGGCPYVQEGQIPKQEEIDYEERFSQNPFTYIRDINEDGPVYVPGYRLEPVRRPQRQVEGPPRCLKMLRKRKSTKTKLEIQTQRLLERDRGIVLAAIDATIAETVEEEAAASKKRALEIQAAEAAPPPKRQAVNIFAKMMKGPQIFGKHTYAPVDFDSWPSVLNTYLMERDPTPMNADYSFLGEMIIKSMKKVVLPEVVCRPHYDTKLNALHLMMEVAMAVAYAPEGREADLVRKSKVPKFLMEHMLKIVETMSTSETKRLEEEKVFIRRLKELRHKPLAIWEGDTWNDLDEILRVLKDPGPVNFRNVTLTIRAMLHNIQANPKSPAAIARSIRTDIAAYITAGSCYETKYNALNALVSVGLFVVEREFFQHNEGAKLVFEALGSSLLEIGRMFDGVESDRLVAEFRSEPELSQPGFLDHFRKATTHTEKALDEYFGLSRQEILYSVISRLLRARTCRHGEGGVLFLILYLRCWEKSVYYSTDTFYSTFQSQLDTLLDLFPDRTVPLQPRRFLQDVDAIFSTNIQTYTRGGWLYIPYTLTHDMQTAFEKSLVRLARYTTLNCPLGMKIDALNILCELALRILEWMHPSHPVWHSQVFDDHLTEDAVTDAMILILRSVEREDWEKVVGNNEVIEHFMELEARRSLLPDALDGLDSVLGLVMKPGHLVTRDERREEVVSFVKEVREGLVVIDLTDD